MFRPRENFSDAWTRYHSCKYVTATTDQTPNQFTRDLLSFILTANLRLQNSKNVNLCWFVSNGAKLMTIPFCANATQPPSPGVCIYAMQQNGGIHRDKEHQRLSFLRQMQHPPHHKDEICAKLEQGRCFIGIGSCISPDSLR